MIIRDLLEKGKKYVTDDLLIVLIIILVGLSSYGLGRLSVIEENRESVYIDQSASVIQSESGGYVGSVNGSIYHLPWCSGAQRIAEKNKVYFDSKVAAEEAGYRPASNCKGI